MSIYSCPSIIQKSICTNKIIYISYREYQRHIKKYSCFITSTITFTSRIGLKRELNCKQNHERLTPQFHLVYLVKMRLRRRFNGLLLKDLWCKEQTMLKNKKLWCKKQRYKIIDSVVEGPAHRFSWCGYL